jgi:hypothetical protein
VIDKRESNLTVARLDGIAGKLNQLRHADRTLSIFGSRSHRYLLGPTLSVSALAEYEERLGGQLPIEYRLFLIRIGHGGAGPYYGLFSLDGHDPEDITELEQIQKPFLRTEALNPYESENPCGMEDVRCDEDVEEGERRQVILRVPGALYVCHYGCGIRFFLIVKGKCVGEVWRDSQTDDRGIMPECNADGRHLGFLDWYEKWLDEGIAAQTTSRITP